MLPFLFSLKLSLLLFLILLLLISLTDGRDITKTVAYQRILLLSLYHIGDRRVGVSENETNLSEEGVNLSARMTCSTEVREMKLT